MSNNQFYLVEYEPGAKGCPYFLSGNFNIEEYEWEINDPGTYDIEMNQQYIFDVTDYSLSELCFDLYNPENTPHVSEAFIELCEYFQVKFRAIPLTIRLRDSDFTKKNYSLFLPYQHESLLCREQSEFCEEIIIETGEPMMHRYFPATPIYAWIKRFSVVPTEAHLFRCLELGQLVASQLFRDEALRRNLQGIRFTPIDDTFIYDPWGDIGA